MMDRCFDYLNRYYLSNSSQPPIGAHCLTLFKERVFNKNKKALCEAILQMITRDRNGEQVNREAVKKAIQIFFDIGLLKPRPMKTKESAFVWQGDRNLLNYDEDFEAKFLKHTMEEYREKAKRWLRESSCPEYLTQVDEAIVREETNADYWLQPETKTKMLRIVEQELISKVAGEVCEKEDSGCLSML